MMFRYRIAALCLLGLLALGQPASAQNRPIWQTNTFEGGIALHYSVPESHDVRFAVVCDNQKQETDVTVFEHIKNVKVDQPITIVLAAGTEKVGFKGQATEEEPDTIFGRAHNVDIKALLAVLRAPGELTAIMGTTQTRYPQAGRAAAADRFAKQCRVK
jgi:hypothetical protein